MVPSAESEIFCPQLGKPCPALAEVQRQYGADKKGCDPDDHARFIAIANGHFVDKNGEDCTDSCALSMLTAMTNLDHVRLVSAEA